MSKYVAHKLSQQPKLQSKSNKKDPVPAFAVATDTSDVAAESAVAEPAASPVPAPIAAVSPFVQTIPPRALGIILCAKLNLC